jgi:hypothetical protein
MQEIWLKENEQAIIRTTGGMIVVSGQVLVGSGTKQVFVTPEEGATVRVSGASTIFERAA